MTTERRLIMHVDDDVSFLKLIAKRLAPKGYDVISLEEPNHVVRDLVSNKCRVVLLDIDMPTKNGLDVLREIKFHDGGIQVVMLTGVVSMSSILRSLRWGAEVCLFKPVTDFSLITVSPNSSFP